MKIEPVDDAKAKVEVINSIKHKYKKLRQLSKSPTFALTYQGNEHTLKKKFGFSDTEAMNIYSRFHSLYKASDDWVNARIDEATKQGYVDVAFGLRVRCHKLKQSILDNSATPPEAEAEKRTIANALGQSWCLLNTRAGIAFNELRRHSPYATSILPIAQIHDAQYFIVKDDPDVILWVNKYLIQESRWQEHPDIKHDQVHLFGELSVFIPNWAHELVIPNECNTKEELRELGDKFFSEEH